MVCMENPTKMAEMEVPPFMEPPMYQLIQGGIVDDNDMIGCLFPCFLGAVGLAGAGCGQ